MGEDLYLENARFGSKNSAKRVKTFFWRSHNLVKKKQVKKG